MTSSGNMAKAQLENDRRWVLMAIPPDGFSGRFIVKTRHSAVCAPHELRPLLGREETGGFWSPT
jgi:hypothetical protein